MTGRPEDPTDVLPDDGDDPTSRLARDEAVTGSPSGAEDAPTERLPDGGEDPPTERLPDGSEDPNDRFDSARRAGTEEMRVRGLAAGELPPDPPTAPTETRPAPGARGRGIGLLVASIAAAVLLVGAYVAAGGLDYKPAQAADPCERRAWTDPGNLEEAAQQFALSAMDGAACELGVSREELTRALADEESRTAFAEERGLSDGEIEDAVRSGINRAIDDAEAAGAISPLVATGLRAAARVMPIDQMLPLLEDASGFLGGDGLNDLDGLLDGVVDSIGGVTGEDGGASVEDSLREAVPDDLRGQLPESITEGLRDQLPEDIEREIPGSVDERIQQGLDELLAP